MAQSGAPKGSNHGPDRNPFGPSSPKMVVPRRVQTTGVTVPMWAVIAKVFKGRWCPEGFKPRVRWGPLLGPQRPYLRRKFPETSGAYAGEGDEDAASSPGRSRRTLALGSD